MSFWAAAQLVPNKTALALHFLQQAGYETYDPLTRLERVHHGRRTYILHQLFPGYAFVEIQLQWHAVRWCPGIVRLVTTDGKKPAAVPDHIINSLRRRERGGVIPLPPKGGIMVGERVRIVSGALSGQLGIFAGQSARERVIVLLTLLGCSRVELARSAIRPV